MLFRTVSSLSITIPFLFTGKEAENALVAADITVNKNMVPFDSRSAFKTSGLRIGTPAITTRGLKENEMGVIVDMIDAVLSDPTKRRADGSASSR